MNISERKGSASSGKKKSISAAAVAAPSEKKTPALPVPSTTESPCLFCELSHSFQNCRKFRKILHKDKISFLMKHRLCFDCLGHSVPGKPLVKCVEVLTLHCCIVLGELVGSQTFQLLLRFHHLLHQQLFQRLHLQGLQWLAMRPSRGHGVVETMPIIPVQVRSAANGMVCKTYAFLDSGSGDTLITEALMRELGVRGKKTTISLTTLSVDDEPTQCFAVPNLEVCGLNESEFVSLPTVFTQKSMPVSVKQVPSQQDIDC